MIKDKIWNCVDCGIALIVRSNCTVSDESELRCWSCWKLNNPEFVFNPASKINEMERLGEKNLTDLQLLEILHEVKRGRMLATDAFKKIRPSKSCQR